MRQILACLLLGGLLVLFGVAPPVAYPDEKSRVEKEKKEEREKEKEKERSMKKKNGHKSEKKSEPPMRHGGGCPNPPC